MAVFPGRQLRADLLEQPGFVRHEPAFCNAAVRDAQDRCFVHVDLAPRRRDAEEIGAMRSRESEEEPHLVAFRDDILDHIHAIGNGVPQVGPGARPALAVCVAAEVFHAGAGAPVVGREQLLDDRVAVGLALRLLEAQRDLLVALDLRAVHIRSFFIRCVDGQQRGCTER
jgi:hypothetical protein